MAADHQSAALAHGCSAHGGLVPTCRKEKRGRDGEEKQTLCAGWIWGEMICWVHRGGLGMGHRTRDHSTGLGRHRHSAHKE